MQCVPIFVPILSILFCEQPLNIILLGSPKALWLFRHQEGMRLDKTGNRKTLRIRSPSILLQWRCRHARSVSTHSARSFDHWQWQLCRQSSSSDHSSQWWLWRSLELWSIRRKVWKWKVRCGLCKLQWWWKRGHCGRKDCLEIKAWIPSRRFIRAHVFQRILVRPLLCPPHMVWNHYENVRRCQYSNPELGLCDYFDGMSGAIFQGRWFNCLEWGWWPILDCLLCWYVLVVGVPEGPWRKYPSQSWNAPHQILSCSTTQASLWVFWNVVFQGVWLSWLLWDGE